MSQWLVAAALLLLFSLAFDLPLLAYAMYALLAAILISRYLTRQWADALAATRECNQLTVEVGDTVAVVAARLVPYKTRSAAGRHPGFVPAICRRDRGSSSSRKGRFQSNERRSGLQSVVLP